MNGNRNTIEISATGRRTTPMTVRHPSQYFSH